MMAGGEAGAGPAAAGSDRRGFDRARSQELMGRLSRILGASTAATLDVAVEECLEQIGTATDSDVAFAILVDDEECITDDWRWVRPGVDVVPPAGGSPLRDTFGSSTEFLRLGHSVAVDDLAEVELAPSERALATANGLRAIVLAPVRIGPTLLGLTGLQVMGEPRHWGKAVVEQLEIIAQMLVQVVQRTRDRGALAAADARARRIAEYIPEGLLLMRPGGTISWVSPSFCRASGSSSVDLLEHSLAEIINDEDVHLLASALSESPTDDSDVVVRVLANGEWRWHEISWRLAHDDDPAVPDEVVVSLRDVHANHLRTLALTERARRDVLTGALNRLGFDDAFRSLAERGESVMLAFVDIDDFKAVNDEAGHGVGDEVLYAVASALRSATRSSDHVARLGGDEFCVIAACEPAGREDAEALASRLLTSVREHLSAMGAPATVSIGVAGPASASDDGALRAAADSAMYVAKRDGGDRYALAAS